MKDCRYRRKLPDVIRIIGKYITENADAMASFLEGTTDYKLTISLKPGDDETIFEPKITAERTNVVLPAVRFYYDVDGVTSGELSEKEAEE